MGGKATPSPAMNWSRQRMQRSSQNCARQESSSLSRRICRILQHVILIAVLRTDVPEMPMTCVLAPVVRLEALSRQSPQILHCSAMEPRELPRRALTPPLDSSPNSGLLIFTDVS